MAPVNGFCEHHYNSLRVIQERQPAPGVAGQVVVHCQACRQTVMGFGVSKADAWAFIHEMYQGQTGDIDIVYRDMVGNVITVGCQIVYPVLSGRSTAMAHGTVLEINPPTKGNDTRAHRYDAPRRLKVQPSGLNSRGWQSWLGGDDDIKAVTLSANAESAVVVG